MGYYNEDLEDDAKAEDVDIEDDVEAENEENDVEAKDEDIENDIEVEDEDIEEYVEEGIDYDEYPYGRPLDWSCIIEVNLRLGPRYDKHGREIPELGSFHNSKLGSLTPYTEEEDDIHARLATLNRKLMIHNFKNLTLKNLEDEDEDEDERIEGNELEATKGSKIYLGNEWTV